MATGSELIRLALFGSPVSQSLSPRIHGLFARQAELTIEYQAVETRPGELRDKLAEFAAHGGLGCNITLPLKGEAMALAEHRSETVQRAGAANTLTRSETGEWLAESTDGAGLIGDLTARGMSTAGRDIALLGAGGAAAGILGALLRSGPSKLVIFNRTPGKAEALATTHTDLGPVSARPLHELADAGPFELLINSTSHGHLGEAPALNAGLFAGGAACYDLNYGPASLPLRERCAALGVRYADGLGMLVGQAAESFQIWTGFTPDREAVLALLGGH
jgi:shikimate dehydrogenase